ncbi:SgcJ/EcaC family oxidoreductase [Sphaerisporangium corydalis]|uniref:SgcJ/EcaC family oxidoreductase n=1 Tax=Sphaerisporangium corydalis TaxID=1441875 RepID=A0ABV9E9Y7_9ACTN|nr:SgcJ/EcaC family oxidoreductase [Sphaerisporangium corydalis]
MGIHRNGRTAVHLALISGFGMALTGAAIPAAYSAPVTTMAADNRPAIPASHQHDSDLAAFEKIRLQQESAWARGDGVAYAAIYSPEADLVNITGEHLHSRRTIATKLQEYFNKQLKKTRLLKLEETVRFIAPTMAVIVRKGCVLYGAEKVCRPDTLSINTSVAVKDAGQWTITSFQNTLVRPGSGRPSMSS